MIVAIANADGRYMIPNNTVSWKLIEQIIENLFVSEYDVSPFTVTIIKED